MAALMSKENTIPVSSDQGNTLSDVTTQALPRYSSSNFGHIKYPANKDNASTINHNDSSNFLALSVINKALSLHLLPQNIIDKSVKKSSSKHPEIESIKDTNAPGNPSTHYLASEYQKIKNMIDKSGVLSPNKNLVTKNRGECFWDNCSFQSEVEEIFRKHLCECHQLTSSVLAELEISLEKSLQLSSLLTKEQNYLYNMLHHLDQQLASLPPEPSPITDNHYITMLLQNSKYSPHLFDSLQNFKSSFSPPVIHESYHPMSNLLPFSTEQSHKFMNSLSLLRHQNNPLLYSNANYQSPVLSTNQDSPPTFTFPRWNVPVDGHCTSPPINYTNASQQLPSLGDVLSHSRSTKSYRNNYDIPSQNDYKAYENRERAQPDDRKQAPLSNMEDRQYYRQYTARPSVSYVNLIKTAILESPRQELSLNEIYLWIQKEFAYFRDREQKWKNAIRHNLSLHKCFQRKHGKMWTFDENEYNIKKTRNRISSHFSVPVSKALKANGNNECDDDRNEYNQQRTINMEIDSSDDNHPDDTILNYDQLSTFIFKTARKCISPATEMCAMPNSSVFSFPINDI